MTIAACGTSTTADSQSTADGSSPSAPQPTTVRVLTHDSFAITESLVTDFTESTGITVEFIRSDDLESCLAKMK